MDQMWMKSLIHQVRKRKKNAGYGHFCFWTFYTFIFDIFQISPEKRRMTETGRPEMMNKEPPREGVETRRSRAPPPPNKTRGTKK